MSRHYGIPFGDFVRKFWSTEPKNVVGQFSIDTTIQKRELMKELMACLEFSGIPDEWDFQYFLEHLFIDGYIGIMDTAVGVVPLKCGVTGYNIYNRPTEIIVANPILGNFRRTIGEDCALIVLQYDYSGLSPLLDLYSVLLAEADAGIAVNLMNCKATFIAECDSKAQSQSMKKMYDTISIGEPAVFVKEGMGSNFTILKPKENYIADQILQLKANIRDEFRNIVGIDVVGNDKKERLITSEVEAMNDSNYYNIQNWLDSIRAGLMVANRLFNLNITVNKREYPNSNPGNDSGNSETTPESEKPESEGRE